MPLSCPSSIPSTPKSIESLAVKQHSSHYFSIPSVIEFLRGTLAQGCNTDLGRALRTPDRICYSWFRTSILWGGSAGVDDLAAIAVEHQLFQRHRPPSRKGRPGSAAGQPGFGGVLQRGRETREPSWLIAGDSVRAAELVGLDGRVVDGGATEPEVVARWLDDGTAPNGAAGRGFSKGSVHGLDLTFAAPKSASLLRALSDEVGDKAMQAAHLREAAMTYLHQHAGYTRVHNALTGRKDLEHLPGLVAIAYQHETSRCGDPHQHTHVIVPNRQARADGALASLDSESRPAYLARCRLALAGAWSIELGVPRDRVPRTQQRPPRKIEAKRVLTCQITRCAVEAGTRLMDIGITGVGPIDEACHRL